MLSDSPIPDLDIPTLPAPVLTLNQDGTASTSRPTSTRKGKALELDSREYERPLSKREKAAVSLAQRGRTLSCPLTMTYTDTDCSSQRRLPFLNSGLPFLHPVRMTCLR